MRTKNKLISAVLFAGMAISSNAFAQTVTGSGTYHYVPMWNTNPTGSTLSNSQIFDNGSTFVGIGTASPVVRLDVNGTINIPQANYFLMGSTKFMSIGGASGSTCTFLGMNAGADAPPSFLSCNTMIGFEAGLQSDNSQFYKNTFVGYQSGYNNQGQENSFFGSQSGTSNTTGDENGFFGSCSGRDNSTGGDNTFMGHWACSYNQYGSNNTAVGAYACGEQGDLSSAVANNNTGIGAYALFYNNPTATTNGNNNTVVGCRALYGIGSGAVNNGTNNCVFGYEGLKNNTTAGDNVVMGANALHTQTYDNGGTAWSSYNVAIGNNALYTNNPTSTSNGYRNTAIGQNAGYSNTTGNLNSFGGMLAGYSNTTGSDNSMFGYQAGYLNTTSSYLTCIGYAAGYNTTGGANSYFGYRAGDNNTSGTNNVAVGYMSGDSYTTGSSDTYLGYDADANANGYSNSSALGNGSQVTGTNDIILGNGSIQTLRCQVGLTVISDKRAKENIQSNVPGLAFIKLLKPVTFHYNVDHENAIIRGTEASADSSGASVTEENSTAKYAIQQTQFSGFIAQSVDSAARQINYDFSGVHKPQNEETDLWGLSYSDFIPPLVAAVQELSKEVDSLKEITSHSSQRYSNNPQDTTAQILPSQNVTLASQKAILYQNNPNPTNEQTSIGYYLSEETTNAQIVFFDMYGKEIKRVELENRGNAKLDVNTKDLDSGIYSYSLIVDGKVIDTLKMIRTK